MIYLGADKHGLAAIKIVADCLASKQIEFVNLGIETEGESIRLEDLIPKVATEVLKDKAHIGILSCGTGVGVEVGANKLAGIRACLVTNEKIAQYARVYDDCNVLCLVGWEPEKATIERIVGAWLTAQYDGNEARLKMFAAFDTWGGRLLK
jgi:ribose 5-phosphate isomerase B